MENTGSKGTGKKNDYFPLFGASAPIPLVKALRICHNHVMPKRKPSRKLRLRKIRMWAARRRKVLEIGSAVLLLAVMSITTWSQVEYFGTDSWGFLVLLNINLLLMLVVVFVVARNVAKLILERRNKIYGSRLSTRLLLAFISVSLIPMVLIFLAANRVMNASVDYWFKSQVENSLQSALEVGQSFYSAAVRRLQGNSHMLLERLSALQSNPEAINRVVAVWQRESGLSLAGFVNMESGQYREDMWHIDPVFASVWGVARIGVNWHAAAETGGLTFPWATPSGDYVISILPVTGEKSIYFVSAESIGRGLIMQLDNIREGFDEYSRLKELKQPLKVSFSLVLGLLSLTIILGAVWVSFRLSRQLTRPIRALAEGTDQVARGQLDLQVADAGRDELGQLVSSFNRMAHEVKVSHARLTTANALLEERRKDLESRNEYIETILDNIATGVVSLDRQGHVLTMNKAAAKMFSTSARLWEGRIPGQALEGDYAQVIKEMYDYLAEHPGRAWQKELEFVWRQRNWRLLIHAVNMPGSDGSYSNQGDVVAVIEDITEMARMQRLSAWREVAKRIAHEIKNPLTPIKLSAQRLERKFGPQIEDAAFSQSTGLIVREVDRLLNMVSEFSSFASLPEVRPKSGNLAPILRELTELFRNSHGRINWSLDMPESLPDLRLDPEAVHRALMNVMGNAAEALEAMDSGNGLGSDGKRVTLRVSVENGPIRDSGLEEDVEMYDSDATPLSHLVVEVEDNGPGLEGEELQRMFEPYFSRKTASKTGGTGLGLAIVRSIILDHNGTISARNAPKGGMIVRMELPLG